MVFDNSLGEFTLEKSYPTMYIYLGDDLSAEADKSSKYKLIWCSSVSSSRHAGRQIS